MDDKEQKQKVEIIEKLVDFEENEDIAEYKLNIETKQAIEGIAEAISNVKFPESKEINLEETNSILKEIVGKINEPCDISVTLTLK